MKTILLFFILFSGLITQARVLSLSDEKFASYFSIETGSSLLSTGPFDQNLVAVDSYSQSYKTGLGGEFGFLYSSPYIGWRFSFEILKPAKLKEVSALAGAAAQYVVDSDVTAISPKLGIELHLNRKPGFRFYLFGYYGSSNLAMTNVYTMVTAPNTDHTVEAKSSASESGGGLGFETSFVDTTSFVFEIGYRSLVFKEIKYSKGVTTFQGSKAAGDLITNLDGSDKKLSFNGYTVSVGFRFYL